MPTGRSWPTRANPDLRDLSRLETAMTQPEGEPVNLLTLLQVVGDVKIIVEGHNGHVTVANTSLGARFTLRLPVSAE